MTEQASIATLNVKMNTLLEARREDLQDKKDERKRRDEERKADRAMMEKLAGHVGEMAVAMTAQTKNNEHLGQRVDSVESRQDVQAKEIKDLQKVSNGNTVRWQTLGAAILGFVAISGIVVTIVLWALERYLGGSP